MITVTKETAIKLKEAGWEKECEFCVARALGVDSVEYRKKILKKYIIAEAPTAQEILDELPGKIYDKEDVMQFGYTLHIFHDEVLYAYSYDDSLVYLYWVPYKKNLADGLGKMWVKLKDDKRI